MNQQNSSDVIQVTVNRIEPDQTCDDSESDLVKELRRSCLLEDIKLARSLLRLQRDLLKSGVFNKTNPKQDRCGAGRSI
jgi:hypothetical protein